MRVVSLLPGATEILHFTGAADTLVGITHECDYPAGVESLPRLTTSPLTHHDMSSAEIDASVSQLSDEGSIYALDAGLLADLSPDLILTQGLCDVCAVSMSVVEKAASALDPRPEILSMNPTSLGEVLDCVTAVGNAVGRADETKEKLAALRRRLDAVESAVAGLPRPRVGCIEWLDPPFSAGHWVPEMARLAGGDELFAGEGEPSARLSWEEVFESEPEILALMPCGFDVGRTVEESRSLEAISGWEELEAVRTGRVWALDANSYFSRPGPRLVRGVEMLARILHPEVFADTPDRKEAAPLSYVPG